MKLKSMEIIYKLIRSVNSINRILILPKVGKSRKLRENRFFPVFNNPYILYIEYSFFQKTPYSLLKIPVYKTYL